MTTNTARAGIVLIGFAGALFHGAVTLLVILGMSLGRLSDDPWNPVAETLMAIAFYGVLAILAVLLWVGYSLRLGAFWTYAVLWMIVVGSFLAAVIIEATIKLTSHPLIISVPIVALSVVVITYWLLRRTTTTEQRLSTRASVTPNISEPHHPQSNQ